MQKYKTGQTGKIGKVGKSEQRVQPEQPAFAELRRTRRVNEGGLPITDHRSPFTVHHFPVPSTHNMQKATTIFDRLTEARKGRKMLAVLIDPDKVRLQKLDQLIELSLLAKIDFFFIGGSLIVNNQLDACLAAIKAKCNIPLVLFPGDSYQLSYRADGILFLSLISGRNPELLIGKHVITAPYLKVSPLEVIPTGYMLVDGGVPTTVSYISNTSPIPSDKNDIAACTAMAGEMLGLKCLYMDAGSGARKPISEEMIATVRSVVQIPIIVGGGIRTPEQAERNVRAGADVIVVGNAFEDDPSLVVSMAQAVHGIGEAKAEAKAKADAKAEEYKG